MAVGNVKNVYESDFLDFKDMESQALTYNQAMNIYKEKIGESEIKQKEESKIEAFSWLRLLFSLVKSGTNYIIKVTSKGKTIKDVRDGKLEVDVSKHINANNRFKDYGNIDKLVEYIVDDIKRLDDLGYAKQGDNTIRTVYSSDNKLLEISFRVKYGKLYNFNAFPGHSTRDLGNVVYLAPQIIN